MHFRGGKLFAICFRRHQTVSYQYALITKLCLWSLGFLGFVGLPTIHGWRKYLFSIIGFHNELYTCVVAATIQHQVRVCRWLMIHTRPIAYYFIPNAQSMNPLPVWALVIVSHNACLPSVKPLLQFHFRESATANY